jgi:hypothetical protein
MKSFYNRLFSQLVFISHPAGGFFSLTDLKKRKQKKTCDFTNNPSPEGYDVRGNTSRKNEWNKTGAP